MVDGSLAGMGHLGRWCISCRCGFAAATSSGLSDCARISGMRSRLTPSWATERLPAAAACTVSALVTALEGIDTGDGPGARGKNNNVCIALDMPCDVAPRDPADAGMGAIDAVEIAGAVLGFIITGYMDV